MQAKKKVVHRLCISLFYFFPSGTNLSWPSPPLYKFRDILILNFKWSANKTPNKLRMLHNCQWGPF